MIPTYGKDGEDDEDDEDDKEDKDDDGDYEETIPAPNPVIKRLVSNT